MVSQQIGPTGCAENVSEIDAAHPNGEIAPSGLSKLLNDLVPIDRMMVLGVEPKGYQDGEHHHSKDQLSFVQAFSDSAVGFIVWAGLSPAALGVKSHSSLIGSALS